MKRSTLHALREARERGQTVVRAVELSSGEERLIAPVKSTSPLRGGRNRASDFGWGLAADAKAPTGNLVALRCIITLPRSIGRRTGPRGRIICVRLHVLAVPDALVDLRLGLRFEGAAQIQLERGRRR